MAIRADPEDTAEDAREENAQPDAAPTPAATGDKSHPSYALGLRDAHDFLRGQSQTNPFAGRQEYGDLASGKAPVTPVPVAPTQSGLGQSVRASPVNTIATQPENVMGPDRTGNFMAGRNVVRETMAGAGSATNGANFPAGLPRTPQQSPEVGGTRAVPSMMPRARNQRATQPSEPAFFGG